MGSSSAAVTFTEGVQSNFVGVVFGILWLVHSEVRVCGTFGELSTEQDPYKGER